MMTSKLSKAMCCMIFPHSTALVRGPQGRVCQCGGKPQGSMMVTFPGQLPLLLLPMLLAADSVVVNSAATRLFCDNESQRKLQPRIRFTSRNCIAFLFELKLMKRKERYCEAEGLEVFICDAFTASNCNS